MGTLGSGQAVIKGDTSLDQRQYRTINEMTYFPDFRLLSSGSVQIYTVSRGVSSVSAGNELSHRFLKVTFHV